MLSAVIGRMMGKHLQNACVLALPKMN